MLLRAFLVCGLLYPFFRLAHVLVYSKIRTNIGIKKGVVSGGGSLTASLDDFFEALGLPVVNGWGLTEVRRPSDAICMQVHRSPICIVSPFLRSCLMPKHVAWICLDAFIICSDAI